MKPDIISLHDLNNSNKTESVKHLRTALLQKGIVGICDVPDFRKKSFNYIKAARQFSALDHSVRQKYAPNRDAGITEGYELGAERFKNKDGIWQVDDKKASYYAYVPENAKNRWPSEVDLKNPYQALGQLIFDTGKLILNAIGLNKKVGLHHDQLVGYGRMLHYHKEGEETNENPGWCGAHFDHGLFTGLIPAWYFRDGTEVDEPEEAGLYILPHDGSAFEKIIVSDKDILLFQTGEFGQLISDDRIRATKHKVLKAKGRIERFTFALFYSADDNTIIKSNSEMTKDERYKANQSPDGRISYGEWQNASFKRYRADKIKQDTVSV